MRTIFFWTAWFLISFWVLKTFYFSASQEKIKRLRFAAVGIDILVLILFFLPWLTATGQSGWELIAAKESLVILVFGMVLLSAVLVLFPSPSANKIGAVLQSGSAALFIAMMIKLMPGTVTLTLRYVAPILVSLLLLINIIIVLLLWQQLQLRDKSHTNL
ncbi:MAG: hypothetical protein AAB410_05660 [Patescibacteria group bacterium]